MLHGNLVVAGIIVLGAYMVGMLGIGIYCNKKYATTSAVF